MSVWCHQLSSCHYHHFSSLSFRKFIKRLVTAPSSSSCGHRKSTLVRASLQSPQLEDLTTRQREKISVYVDTLLQWNQRMNLTAVKETSDVLKRHVEDSLAIIPPIQNSYLSHCGSSCDGLKLVDVGSGPGLPGLIFAIACPSWKVTLLESMQKRCLFLEHAVAVTGLSNVQILRARAEDAGQNQNLRETFDVSVARAVAEMRILEYCLPFVRVGGLFVAAKGYDPQEEIDKAKKAIQVLGASTLQLCSVESHGPYGQRTAVVCIKDHRTPRKYPRPPGQPAKAPL